MELDTAIQGPGRLIVQTNKIHHVFTIDRVASDLGENEEWLADIANEMEPEDGLIWVYNLSDGGGGLERALAGLWSGVLTQRCSVHKHRNLLAHAPNVSIRPGPRRDDEVDLGAVAR